MARMKTTLHAAAELLDIDPDDLFLMIDTEQIAYQIHADSAPMPPASTTFWPGSPTTP